MCGRFALVVTPQLLKEYFSLTAPISFHPQYNIAPGQHIYTVYHQDNMKRNIAPMKWGFIPQWYKEEKAKVTPINARIETLHENKIFKQAAVHQRCLIPLTGYYEWQALHNSKKQPYFITQPGKSLFALAGIWSCRTFNQNTHYSVAIITHPANDKLKFIHSRMPMALLPQHFEDWLSDKPNEVIEQLIQLSSSTDYEYWPVTADMNKPTYDNPDCLKPIILPMSN